MKTLYQENTNFSCFLQNRRGFLYILGTKRQIRGQFARERICCPNSVRLVFYFHTRSLRVRGETKFETACAHTRDLCAQKSVATFIFSFWMNSISMSLKKKPAGKNCRKIAGYRFFDLRRILKRCSSVPLLASAITPFTQICTFNLPFRDPKCEQYKQCMIAT